MPFSTKTIKNAIHKSLTEREFVITFEGTDGYYLIKNNNDFRTISMQLAIANSVDINRQSHEGNEISSMNYITLQVPIGEPYPDFFIMALENAGADRPEFIIIPSATLNEKLFDLGLAWRRKVCLSFLIYSDGKAFNITSLSFEGRWFLLRKGLRGRMADGSVYDYSEWLNNWAGLIKV